MDMWNTTTSTCHIVAASSVQATPVAATITGTSTGAVTVTVTISHIHSHIQNYTTVTAISNITGLMYSHCHFESF